LVSLCWRSYVGWFCATAADAPNGAKPSAAASTTILPNLIKCSPDLVARCQFDCAGRTVEGFPVGSQQQRTAVGAVAGANEGLGLLVARFNRSQRNAASFVRNIESCWRMTMRASRVVLIATVPLGLFGAEPLSAKGCIRGAIVGGVAGHYAHHHAVAGALAGCAAGHIYYKHKARQATHRH
jgi:hypothetical protein